MPEGSRRGEDVWKPGFWDGVRAGEGGWIGNGTHGGLGGDEVNGQHRMYAMCEINKRVIKTQSLKNVVCNDGKMYTVNRRMG